MKRYVITCLAATGALAAVVASACSAPDSAARIDAAGPDRAQFASVHPVLMRRCGSLECHGVAYRNLRLWGYQGARLPGTVTKQEPIPVDGGIDGGDAGTREVSTVYPSERKPLGPETPPDSTDTELAASYDAVVGLEPEIMREVVAAKGAGSNRLTFVRKGRGDEAHKGLQRYCPGDSADRCIQTWLAGRVDPAACQRALEPDPPGNCALP